MLLLTSEETKAERSMKDPATESLGLEKWHIKTLLRYRKWEGLA